MIAIPYTTVKGEKQFMPKVLESELGEYLGFCLACGAEAHNVEPDARRYTCEACGAEKVYGLEELLLMNLLQFEDQDE